MTGLRRSLAVKDKFQKPGFWRINCRVGGKTLLTRRGGVVVKATACVHEMRKGEMNFAAWAFKVKKSLNIWICLKQVASFVTALAKRPSSISASEVLNHLRSTREWAKSLSDPSHLDRQTSIISKQTWPQQHDPATPAHPSSFPLFFTQSVKLLVQLLSLFALYFSLLLMTCNFVLGSVDLSGCSRQREYSILRRA